MRKFSGGVCKTAGKPARDDAVMYRDKQLPQYLQVIIAEFIARKVEVPAGVLPTVTKVEVSKKFRYAKIWISVLPEDRALECLEAINANLYDIQGEVNRKVEFRPAPRISFKLDFGPKYASRIEELIENLDE